MPHLTAMLSRCMQSFPIFQFNILYKCNNLTQDHKKIYKAIDQLPWEQYDSVGVNDSEGTRDEYNRSIPEVFRLKFQNAGAAAITNYLFAIETERMGLTGNIEACRQITAKVIAVKS